VSAPDKVYDFSEYAAKATQTDFVMQVSDGQSITIRPLTLNTVLKLDQTADSLQQLQLLCGDQWDAVQALMGECQPAVINAFLVDLKVHFGMESAA
jgi:hypothetical protein